MAQAPRILAGRYEVGELIGRGGMAEVHIGHDARLGRTVAIKILRSDLARDPSFQARFRREAQSAASLNHPAVVAVYDTGEETYTDDVTGATAHVPFIVMEYVEGHTVRDIVRDGHAVPIDEAVEIVVGVLSALEYSHQAGIVHRDIKPANVMLTPTGAVKVMDFGIARAMADSAATMTQTQAVIGTAQYLSPEQARGETVDARSDLYSTGCLLFELLTGRPPFIGDSPVAVAYQHVREAPPLPSSLAGDVPESLDRITLRSLAKERDARYSSAAEFRADLETAMHGGQIAAPTLAVVSAAATGAPEASVDPNSTQVFGSATQALPAAHGWAPTGATAAVLPPGVFPGAAAAQPMANGLAPDPEESKSRAGLKWTLISVGIVAIAALIFLFLVNNPRNAEPDLVAMPALTGMTSAEAGKALKAVGLTMKSFSEPDLTPEGEFIRSDPGQGSEVPEGSTVNAYFSTGPSSVKIPDVAGRTTAEARSILEAAGLEVGIDVGFETGGSVPREAVTRTVPKAKDTVAEGTVIKLFVSDGQVEVPSLLGMSEKKATQALKDLKANLNIKVVEEPSEEPDGDIINQQPAAGLVTQGADIVLTVAIPMPIEKVTIPTTLYGMTQSDAEAALRALGLNPVIKTEKSDQAAAGIVFGVTPGLGDTVDEGSDVTLFVSKGPGPAPEPSPEPPAPAPTEEADDGQYDDGQFDPDDN